jgi:hypothetical protein
MTEFIEHPSDQVRSLVADPDPETSRRPLRVLLVGDRQDVLATIQNLHGRGFAPAGHWSRPLPWRTPEETLQPQLLTLPPGSGINIYTQYFSWSFIISPLTP